MMSFTVVTLKVAAIDKSISNGTKVADEQISTLVEMLMRQAVVVEGIPAEGEAAFKKTLQVIYCWTAVELPDDLRPRYKCRARSLCRRKGCRSLWKPWMPSTSRMAG